MLIMEAAGAPEVFVGLFFILFMVIMFALSIGLLAFWIWALVDCCNNTPSEQNLKLVWILVIVFAGWIGAIIYLVAQRPKNHAIQ